MGVTGCSRCPRGVVGQSRRGLQALRGVELASRSALESAATEGERPVGEVRFTAWVLYLSRPGHEKSRLKLAGPSVKAKYDPVTDSGRVP